MDRTWNLVLDRSMYGILNPRLKRAGSIPESSLELRSESALESHMDLHPESDSGRNIDPVLQSGFEWLFEALQDNQFPSSHPLSMVSPLSPPVNGCRPRAAPAPAGRGTFAPRAEILYLKSWSGSAVPFTVLYSIN